MTLETDQERETIEKDVADFVKAAQNQNFTKLEDLIAKYKDSKFDIVNAKNKDGESAMFSAATLGHNDMVKFIHQKGATANTHKTNGDSALAVVAQLGNKAMINLLLTIGADINSRSVRGETPLSVAIIHGHKESATMLLEHGADPNIQGRFGDAALHIIAKRDMHELVPVLLSKGAKPGMANDGGDTALHIAAKLDNVAVAKDLLKTNHLTKAKNKRGLTALDVAKGGTRDIICAYGDGVDKQEQQRAIEKLAGHFVKDIENLLSPPNQHRDKQMIPIHSFAMGFKQFCENTSKIVNKFSLTEISANQLQENKILQQIFDTEKEIMFDKNSKPQNFVQKIVGFFSNLFTGMDVKTAKVCDKAQQLIGLVVAEERGKKQDQAIKGHSVSINDITIPEIGVAGYNVKSKERSR